MQVKSRISECVLSLLSVDLVLVDPGPNAVLSSAVDLVELHDAAGPVGAGAAPPAAEAEAAARSRRHEPASLNGSQRRFVSGRQNDHHQEKREEKKQKFDEDELQLKWKIKPARNGGGWGGDTTPRRG